MTASEELAPTPGARPHRPQRRARARRSGFLLGRAPHPSSLRTGRRCPRPTPSPLSARPVPTMPPRSSGWPSSCTAPSASHFDEDVWDRWRVVGGSDRAARVSGPTSRWSWSTTLPSRATWWRAVRARSASGCRARRTPVPAWATSSGCRPSPASAVGASDGPCCAPCWRGSSPRRWTTWSCTRPPTATCSTAPRASGRGARRSPCAVARGTPPPGP